MCGRTGSPSGAAAGQRSLGRRAVNETVGLAWDYRVAPRRYDSNSPYNDPLMYEVAGGPPRAAEELADEYARYSTFCHDTVGALFEALSELDYRETETVEVEAYPTLAEVVDDRDDFCLTLVWSLMSELNIRPSADEQRAVVEMAAGLFCPTSAPNPVGAAPQHLETVGFVEGYSVRPIPDVEAAGTAGSDARTDARTDGDDSSRTRELTLGDYAFAERTDRVPTLLFTATLVRRTSERAVCFLDGEALSGGRWRPRLRISPKNGAGHAPGLADLVSVEAIENRWLNDPNAPSGR